MSGGHLAALTAIYILARDYHSGQASKGYRLLCMAQERCLREHNVHIGRVITLFEDDDVVQSVQFKSIVRELIDRWQKTAEETF